jgi:hypothetical protein
MAFIVIYDANVLYPNTLRDLLIRVAQQPHLVQAKWTGDILDEMLRALQRPSAGHRSDRGQRTSSRAASLAISYSWRRQDGPCARAASRPPSLGSPSDARRKLGWFAVYTRRAVNS